MWPLANLALVAAEPTRHCAALDQSSFGGGNITGGLSTIEEKSIGAYAKSGTNPIARHAAPGRATAAARPVSHGHVPDDETKWGFANINDNATIVEQIACGAHIVLSSTGRGSPIASGGSHDVSGNGPGSDAQSRPVAPFACMCREKVSPGRRWSR
jgi:altronate hydrolase